MWCYYEVLFFPVSVDGGEFEKPVAKPKCKVWKHFGFQPMLMARSWTKRRLYVDCAIIRYSGNTSNLIYHLQWAHSQELVKLHEDNGDKPGPSVLPTVKQPSLKQQSLLGIIEISILFPQDSGWCYCRFYHICSIRRRRYYLFHCAILCSFYSRAATIQERTIQERHLFRSANPSTDVEETKVV